MARKLQQLCLALALLTMALPAAARSRRADSRPKLPFYISFESLRQTRVYMTPTTRAKVLGAVLKGTRFPMYEQLRDKPCRRGGHYIRLGRGLYGCSQHFTPSLKFPGGDQHPRLRKGALLHREFMKVLKPNTPAFNTKAHILSGTPSRFMPTNAWVAYRRNFLRVGGVLYMRNEKSRLIPYLNLDKRDPSQFGGVHLARRPTHQPAVVTTLGGAALYERPGSGLVRTIPQRSWIRLIPDRIVTIQNRRYFKRLDGHWVSEKDIRRILFSRPPPYLNTPRERWIEVNLTEQSLVTYEGERPTFMTLVSTARKGFKTPTGAFRIFFKRASLTIGHRRGKRWAHLFEDVPWVQFFKGTLAIHTSYWHDLFGNPFSMGCIELSPKDAREIFQWTTPSLPAGFYSISQRTDHPGTLVRIVKYQNQRVNYRAKKKFLPSRRTLPEISHAAEKRPKDLLN